LIDYFESDGQKMLKITYKFLSKNRVSEFCRKDTESKLICKGEKQGILGLFA